MRVGMTDDDARRVDALLGEDPQLGKADARLDAVRRDRHAGPTDARAAARCTRSSSALTHGLSVPISPMIPGRTPVSPTPSANSRTITAPRSSTVRRSIIASAG